MYLANLAGTANNNCNVAQSVQNTSEALALLIITIAYLVLVSYSVAMLRRAELAGRRALGVAAWRQKNVFRQQTAVSSLISGIIEDTMEAAAQQRQRLTTACIVVMITFPARAAFDFLNAYSSLNQGTNSSCGMCDLCQSNQALIGSWINYTPEFQPIVVALSSPLPISLSLWIITQALARAQSIAVDVQQATTLTEITGS